MSELSKTPNHDTVETDSPTFLARVGKVGPVTLKNSPIDIRAPTIPAMKSRVAHTLLFGIQSHNQTS